LSKKDAAQAVEFLAECCEQFLAIPPVVPGYRVFQIGANLNDSTCAQITSAKRPDSLWERFAPSIPVLFARGIELAELSYGTN